MSPRKADHVKVDPQEYEALVHLRDVTHAALKVREIAALDRAEMCRRVNQSQLDQIVQLDLRVTHLTAERDKARADAARFEAEAIALRTEAAKRAPVVSSEVQPLFAKIGGRP